MVQALKPWKKALDFSIPIKKISERAGDRGFVSVFLSFFFFFFFTIVVLNYIFPKNVHKIKELKCFFSLNHVDNPAS